MQLEIQQIIRDFESALARIILYSIKESPISLGISKTIGILRGTKSSFVIERNLYRISTYGILPSMASEYLRKVIDVLIESEFLDVEMVSQYENMPVLKLSKKGREFLSGHSGMDVSFVEKYSNREVICLSEEEQELFDELKKLRLNIAVTNGIPAYAICHDGVLRELAKSMPEKLDALLSIHGIGEKFVKKYGKIFLETIGSFLKRRISNK